MLKLRTVQANYGDCFLVGYGSATARYLLVDGGPEETYARDLRGELERLAASGIESLELVVVSHVDRDHIVGLLDFFADNEVRVVNGQDPVLAVNSLWFNTFDAAIDRGSGLQGRLQGMLANTNSANTPHAAIGLEGIGEGNALRLQALSAAIPINDGFPANLVCVDDAPNPIVLDNLTITVVGPTRANLDELREKWEEWIDRFQPAFAARDLRLMANADQSVPNLSSIMLHIAAEGKSILLTGDGRSDHLLQGLAAAGLLDQDGKLHVDVLKVAHHGSDRNATKTFYRKVTAETYVISANGHPDNPDLASLIWIVETARDAGRRIVIRVTNETQEIRKLLDEYPQAEYGYELEAMPPQWHYWDLDLA